MSAIGFDTLKFARKLKEAGVPAQQAEAQAEVLGEAFLYNLDEIVTRDYLDARLAKLEAGFEKRFSEWETGFEKRFSEFETGFEKRFSELETGFEKRFSELETGFEKRFSELETRFEKRCAELEAGFDRRFAQLETGLEKRFSNIDSRHRLHSWMLGVIVLVNVIPVLSGLLG